MKDKKWLWIGILFLLLFSICGYFVSQYEILTIDQFFIDNVVLSGRNSFFTVLFKGITFFGSVFGIVLISCLFSILVKEKKTKISYFLHLGGAVLISQALKQIFRRGRPLISYRLVEESGYSFPSGHSLVATAVYSYFLYLVWKSSIPRKGKIVFSIGLACLILGIGFSRIYLGVHYASDVFAGLFLGIGYTILFLWVQKRRKNEKETYME